MQCTQYTMIRINATKWLSSHNPQHVATLALLTRLQQVSGCRAISIQHWLGKDSNV